MPVPVGLLFTGLILTTILVVVIAALLVFSWKIGRLADAYTEKRGRLIVLHLRTSRLARSLVGLIDHVTNNASHLNRGNDLLICTQPENDVSLTRFRDKLLGRKIVDRSPFNQGSVGCEQTLLTTSLDQQEEMSPNESRTGSMAWSHGMNTQDDLRTAFDEYRNGTFIKHKKVKN